MPSVPEVSLIFEKPVKTRNLNDGDISSSSARTTKLMQCFDKPIGHISIKSPNSGNHSLHAVNPTLLSSNHHDSYTTWKKQVYSKENNYVNKAHVSPCKNIYSYNHVPQSNIQDVTVQKQQEQDKISDLGPITQNRLINTRHNDGIHEKSVKFRYSNTKDLLSHDDEHETQLSSSNKRQLTSCDPLQGPTCLTDTRVPSNTYVDALKQNEHLQIPYTPCPYPFQQFYPPSYSNSNIDNNETVKTLLQLVNNQSEQIKTLQLQVDRLVRLQEESFRNKSNCACSSSHANQVFGYSAINYDTTNTCTQSHNQVVNQNTIQGPSMIENKSPENLDREKDNNKLDVALLEQQSKKAFMEQKVSIGVMTSFEFTVQNSPFLVDSEMYKEKEIPAEESDDIDGRSTVNMHDTPEPVKRYKNTFTRKSGTAQLENIVEDTESYLSSSHQQSSNFNASSSVRDSERHTPKQPDLYNTNNISESTKMYQHLVTDPNREKMREREMYVKKGGSTDEQVQCTKIIPNTFRKASSPETASYDKVFAAKNVHDYIAMDKGKDNERTNSNSNKRNSHDIQLPTTNHYQNRKKREPDTNIRETGNVDDSIILSGGELKILERPPPTPEPSIHVDMQEYMSDDESDKFKRTSKIGWTFYNNVLGQVNEILQNSSVVEDKEHQEAKPTHRVEQEDDTEARTLNTVKATTLEQLRKLGISITDEHREPNVNNKTYVSLFLLVLNCCIHIVKTL